MLEPGMTFSIPKYPAALFETLLGFSSGAPVESTIPGYIASLT